MNTIKKFFGDVFFVLSLALLAPGLPGAIFTTWLMHKCHKEDHFHQTMEGFVFFCMVWSVIFWSVGAIYLAWTFLSH